MGGDVGSERTLTGSRGRIPWRVKRHERIEVVFPRSSEGKRFDHRVSTGNLLDEATIDGSSPGSKPWSRRRVRPLFGGPRTGRSCETARG